MLEKKSKGQVKVIARSQSAASSLIGPTTFDKDERLGSISEKLEAYLAWYRMNNVILKDAFKETGFLKRKPKSHRQMEITAIILSLPHKTNQMVLPDRPAGLPINALPGWESIPLYSKLPMLKCPNNQVIFSKNKIGRAYEDAGRDFDTVCLNAKMEYNPLHDPHLGRFYNNEKVLKRLRENGEITENNDVICTLKEFNEHRIPLHETYAALVRLQQKKMTENKVNKRMIAHAEEIARREREVAKNSFKASKCFVDVIKRKADLAAKRNQWLKTIQQKNVEKQEKIKAYRMMQEVALKHKKELNNYRIQHTLDNVVDIRRKKLIAHKKRWQFKKDRLKRNIKLIKERSARIATEKAELSWQMHLEARALKHEKYKEVARQTEKYMKFWIEAHKKKYQEKWKKIQEQLQNRCRRRGNKPKKSSESKHTQQEHQPDSTMVMSYEDQLKDLTPKDIHNALQTAIDIEDPEKLKSYEEEDYIFKAAKYIMEGILAKFNQDLSDNEQARSVLENRLRKLFTDVKQHALRRAMHIISADRASTLSARSRAYSLGKGVSFNSYSTLIGIGSYALTDSLKYTRERPPTPASSLTSVIMEPDGDEIDDGTLGGINHRKSLHLMARDQRIFIEHLFIKFKRKLLVGIGRQVLAAIECHKQDKILGVRKELKDIDKEFLVQLMTRSILSYAVNSKNFYSNLCLCQSALAGEIITILQKSILKPRRDPRVIVQPRSRCVCVIPPPFSVCCK